MQPLFKQPEIRRFAIFTLLAGTIMGYYAALSDTIRPWEDVSWWQTFNYAISNIINDFVFWLIIAILAGYIFAHTWRRAMLYGTIIGFYAMVVYVVCNLCIPNSGANFDAIGMAVIGLAAIFGGAFGGWIGHAIKKQPVVLAILFGFTVFRLQGALPATWGSPIGLPRNIFLCVVLVLVLGYWAFRMYQKLQAKR